MDYADDLSKAPALAIRGMYRTLRSVFGDTTTPPAGSRKEDVRRMVEELRHRVTVQYHSGTPIAVLTPSRHSNLFSRGAVAVCGLVCAVLVRSLTM
jgi:hypothetical protein